jgi:hypothetical protein
MRLEKLKKMLACPVDWKQETKLEVSFGLLEHDWFAALAEHAVSREEVPSDLDDLDLWYEDDDEEELERIIKNFEMRLSPAKKTYFKRAGRLSGLTFLTPSEHRKHFVGGAARQDVTRRSSTGPSLFFKNLSSDELRYYFWFWFLWFFGSVPHRNDYEELMTEGTGAYQSPQGQLWHRFLKEHQIRVCVDVVVPVGACKGQETSLLCLDVHIDAKTAHGYPVSRAEAVAIMGDNPIEKIDPF